MKAILACDEAGGIGKNGSLPWPKHTDDLRWFKNMTTGKTVVMGHNTWHSDGMPRPLPNRKNIVISNVPISGFSNVKTYTKNKFTRAVLPYMDSEDVWLIGGAKLFRELTPYITELHLSCIPGTYNCDTFIPDLYENFFLQEEQHGDGVLIEIWKNKLL